jgi:outer membrane protein assembly factor BamB
MAVASVLLVVAPLTAAPLQEHWPSFRGADALNVGIEDPRLPETWSATENIAWSVEVPGLGWSSPIVWDDKIFVTTVWSEGETEEPKKGLYFGGERTTPSQDVHHWAVYCYRMADGSKCWEREVHAAAPDFPRHLKNTYASETPTTDGERVYAYFGNLGVWAFTLDGEEVWHRRFDKVATRYDWGTAASPIVHDGTLFVVNDNDDQSYLLALDARTGEERWRVDRDEGSNWATPFVWVNPERGELITTGTDEVRSYSLDGELLWHFDGMSSITIPQPFAEHGLLYVTSGYIGDRIKPVFAVRPGASGDISLAEGQKSNDFIVWYQDGAGPYHPTPLVLGDYYFTLLDLGFYTVHDARTGEPLYFTEEQKKDKSVRRRLMRGSGGFTASPWAYNGRIFALSESGDTYVLDPAKGFEVVGTNSLDETAMSSPAMARGSLFIRTRSHLWRLTEAKPGGAPTGN